jgi:predicted RNA-binding Zn-ribbon protein involved in translation (DUF1610 family)
MYNLVGFFILSFYFTFNQFLGETMPDNHAKSNAIEKMCHDTDCAEKISHLNPEQQKLFNTFTYCPYCAEELMLICHSCREQLNGNEFKYCPWCGVKFDEPLER